MTRSRMQTRPLTLLAVCGLAGASLAGCASTGTAASTVAEDCEAAHADLSTFTPGTLTVGVPENLPYTATDGAGATGLEIDLIEKIAAAECLNVAYVPITYANGIPMISEQRKTDLITGGWYVTEARAEQVGFTSPIWYDTMGIISADGASTITELESIGDVGSVAGFSWESDVNSVLGGSLKTYPGTVEAKQDLVSGRVQATLDGYAVATVAYADTDFKVEPVEADDRVAITVEKPIIAFPIDPDNAALSDAISEVIDGYREDGTLAGLLEDYQLPAELLVPADVASTSIR
ncbi:MAG: substrate-binding periplasmic protein [Pseudoclavibacter sp.]